MTNIQEADLKTGIIDLSKSFIKVNSHCASGEIDYDLKNDKFIITLFNGKDVLIGEISGTELHRLAHQRGMDLSHLAENS
jgi:hypothetical protein